MVIFRPPWFMVRSCRLGPGNTPGCDKVLPHRPVTFRRVVRSSAQVPGGCKMTATDTLLKPDTCVVLLVDFQAGVGFAVESASRQVLLNNAVALARTASAFSVPVVVSTSASHVYSGPLFPALQDALPAVKAIERKPMNVWEDD